MQTERLQQFKTLVETGNMRRAAELLRISNGGLSRSISALERELRVKLIVPAGRGIAITDDGKRIYTKIDILLKQVEDLVHTSATKSQHPVLRLGTFEVFSTYFLSILTKNFLPTHELILREYVPGKLEIAIAENIVDFGISYAPVPYAGIDFIEIGIIQMNIFALKKNKFDGQFLPTIPFVAPNIPIEGSPSGMKGLDGWPDHLYERHIAYRVELMEAALALCRAGLCVGFFPQFVIDIHNNFMQDQFHLHPIALPENFKIIKRPVYLIKKSLRQEDTLMRSLAKAMRAICFRVL